MSKTAGAGKGKGEACTLEAKDITLRPVVVHRQLAVGAERGARHQRLAGNDARVAGQVPGTNGRVHVSFAESSLLLQR